MSDERISDIPIPNECKNCIFSAFKQFQPRWIPVTERLPEADNRVLICNDKGRYMVGFIKSWRWGNEWSYQCNMYDYDAYDEQEQGKLVAWMPLPEPYRKEKEDE